MTDIGSRLQQGRLQRALTLRQISDATKIPLSVLEALERNDFAHLPGGLFARGYVRAYAGQVGLDPEELVEELRARAGAPDDQLVRMHSLLAKESSLDRLRLPFVLLLGLLTVIYGAVASRSEEPPSTSASDNAIAQTLLVEAKSSTRTGVREISDEVSSSEARVPVAGDNLRLELRPLGLCWISAAADGRPVLYELMQPGERVTLDARNEITLRVGDAGVFAFVINGVPGRRLGGPGEVVSVRITKGNYRTWQTTSPPSQETVDGGGLGSQVPL